MKCKIFVFFVVLFSLCSFSQGKFSGYMFGDYYYVLKNHDESLEGKNGFWFRRIYFTYDYKFNENLFSRLRLEMNSPGDFTTKDKMKPFVKDAYLGFKSKNLKGYFGISPSPTWEFIENFWGYRAVEKTPADLYKNSHSRDFGIAFKGKLSNYFSYHFMFGNGEGEASETNKGKKTMLSFMFHKKDFYTEFYLDNSQEKDDKDKNMYQVFLGLKKKKFTLGLQAYQQNIKQGEGSKDLKLKVYSAFLNLNLNEKMVLLMRADKSDEPNPFISKQSYIPFDTEHPFMLYIFGFDFKVYEGISILPNLTYVNYEKFNGTKPESDLYFKLTIFYKFSQ